MGRGYTESHLVVQARGTKFDAWIQTAICLNAVSLASWFGVLGSWEPLISTSPLYP